MRIRSHRKKVHVLRTILLLLFVLLAYTIIGGYMPFARMPALSRSWQVSIEDEVARMSQDADTADRVAILETRSQALDERIRLINQAQEELVIVSYDCRDGESTRDIVCAAMARADAGVRVRMLVDGISGRLFLSGSELFHAFAAHENVEIRLYSPPTPFAPWKYMGRMHDKYVIADTKAFILGGRNMFDHFIGDYPSASGTYSHDREALVYANEAYNSSIHHIRVYFDILWKQEYIRPFDVRPLNDDRRSAIYAEMNARYEALKASKPDLFAPADYPAMTLPTRGVWLVSNPTNIDAKEPVVFETLCALMDTAREEITIHSPYCVLNDTMRARLAGIAGKVPVTLMVNAVENGANMVASGDYLYHKDEVLSTGMQVLEYAGGDSYHGKSIAIDDDISVIGSYNLDLRSTFVDTELMLVIRGKEVNALLRGHMESLHRDCRRVIDARTAEVPEGLEIPPLSAWKRVALRVVGALMQPVRNLV